MPAKVTEFLFLETSKKGERSLWTGSLDSGGGGDQGLQEAFKTARRPGVDCRQKSVAGGPRWGKGMVFLGRAGFLVWPAVTNSESSRDRT